MALRSSWSVECLAPYVVPTRAGTMYLNRFVLCQPAPFGPILMTLNVSWSCFMKPITLCYLAQKLRFGLDWFTGQRDVGEIPSKNHDLISSSHSPYLGFWFWVFQDWRRTRKTKAYKEKKALWRSGKRAAEHSCEHPNGTHSMYSKASFHLHVCVYVPVCLVVCLYVCLCVSICALFIESTRTGQKAVKKESWAL